MKVGIIAANNIRYSPYIFFYTKILNELNIDYELIYPNRNKIEENFTSSVVEIEWDNQKNTLFNYLSYSKKVKKKILERKYDFLIVLTSNNAVFLSNFLSKKYKKKYIIDIRDYTHENVYLYFLLEKKAIKNSTLNIISSKKFEKFLPKGKYEVCHNINANNTIDFSTINKRHVPIIVGYVGALGYIDKCKKFMDLVSLDYRFEFHFYGTSNYETELKEYAKKLNCDRIKFFGAYANEHKQEIIKKIDILFNIYGNGKPLLDYALSNKLYDSLLNVKPILTSPKTFMEEMAGSLSYSINLENFANLDDLYDWYSAIDFEYEAKKAQEKLLKIKREHENTIIKIKEIIKSNK